MNAPHSSTRVKRFHFVPFDKPEAAPAVAPETKATAAEPPAPPPPPSFSEAQLQAARTEAHAKGYKEGFDASQATLKQEAVEREKADRLLFELISNRITLAAEEHRTYRSALESNIGKLAMMVARKIAGEAMKREPYAAAEALMKECAALLIGQERVTVTTSPQRAEGLRQRIGLLIPQLKGFEGEMVVEEDETLTDDQDCRVSWTSGSAERRSDTLWRDIEAIIAKTPVNPV